MLPLCAALPPQNIEWKSIALSGDSTKLMVGVSGAHPSVSVGPDILTLVPILLILLLYLMTAPGTRLAAVGNSRWVSTNSRVQWSKVAGESEDWSSIVSSNSLLSTRSHSPSPSPP
jgi:hypothetical protein